MSQTVTRSLGEIKKGVFFSKKGRAALLGPEKWFGCQCPHSGQPLRHGASFPSVLVTDICKQQQIVTAPLQHQFELDKHLIKNGVPCSHWSLVLYDIVAVINTPLEGANEILIHWTRVLTKVITFFSFQFMKSLVFSQCSDSLFDRG